jgi:transglycosylase-like protein with SLT domain
MGRLDRRADGSPAPPASRWRSASLPVGSPAARRIAAVGAIAVLGFTLHDGIPAAAGKFPGQDHAPRGTVGPADAAAPASVPHLQAGGWAPLFDTANLAASRAAASQAVTEAAKSSPFRQIILPDLLIVAPKGLTATQVAKLRRIAGVRNMITFDGAEITAGGRPVSVIGVDPATFRSWVPLATASDQAFWSALSHGEFVASQSSGKQLGLKAGVSYTLTGATSQAVRYAMAAKLGLNGVDLLVNEATSRKLGLVRQVAGLISAPGVSLTTLDRKVAKILGPGGRIEVLRSQQLPVSTVAPGTRPTTYLQLFKASAAEYCPGLSWTVLAAIGQIESADGENMGPSTAGALGPMQFLPSTWAAWGIDGFGDTGTPNIMNPYDAVPSAARLLCTDGAAAGGSSLYHAIFDYNHANWYVNEVLGLAAEYAADYK